MNLTYKISKFDELSNIELYRILYLREQVFNIEQNLNCPDLDNLDMEATHITAYNDQQLSGYCRIYEVEKWVGKIGRVVVCPKFRGNGLASKIVNMAVEELKTQNMNEILIRGQSHLVKLYERCGFEVISKPFMYEGIVHLDFAKRL
jgi:ElaA protein